jgi:hypothetical protein
MQLLDIFQLLLHFQFDHIRHFFGLYEPQPGLDPICDVPWKSPLNPVALTFHLDTGHLPGSRGSLELRLLPGSPPHCL